MVLVVEDGTGLANADSYISLIDAESYVTDFEPEGKATWDLAGDPAKEVALRKSTQWLDTTYVLRWKGSRLNKEMSLDWPRQRVVSEGATLESDEVPVRIEQATVEAAVRFLTGELTADVALGQGEITREKSELGPLKEDISYAGQKATQKRVPKVDSLISTLVHSSNRLSLA